MEVQRAGPIRQDDPGVPKLYPVHLIEDDIWLKMLKVRNNLMHDYDGMFEKKAVYQIRDVYLPVFDKFRNNVSQHIQKMKNES